MAITTVNARYEGFIFDGQNSRNYGVYVTDVEVFGAPVRNVEMIQIPGRNGAYALDNGFYENIQVTYKCAMGCESQADFNAGISAFRNMLASRIGYKRLEDEINADEYRMACFHGGISVPTLNKDTATFDVVFDCKPQRFLKSGETAVTIGGDVTNTKTESGTIVSIKSDGGDAVTSLVAQIEPVQAGSGDPSPTNVRPITGQTSSNFYVGGKNILRINRVTTTVSGVTFTINSDGSIHVEGTATANNVYLNLNYAGATKMAIPEGTWKAKVGAGASGNVRLQLISNNVWRGQGGTADFNSITIPEGSYNSWCRLQIQNSGTTVNETLYPMICADTETSGAFKGYDGKFVSVSFGSAGTVYGGTLDVVTGVLTVKWAAERIGALAWGYNSTGKYFYTSSANKATGAFNLMSDIYATATVDDVSRMGNYHIKGSSTNNNIFVTDSRYTTVADFKTANDQKYIYIELPASAYSTYNLTAKQVELLTGQNHVWADTGDITITWGDDPNKLVNPTLYNAHPLLAFTTSGAGTININNDTISVTNQPIGDIVLANVVKLESGESVTWSDTSRYLTGDAIRIDSIPAIQTTVVTDSYSYANYTSYSSDDMDYLSTASTSRGMLVTHSIPTTPQYVAGTAKSDTYSATVINKVKHKTTGNIVDCTINISINIAYDGVNNITVTNTVSTSIGTASTAVTINTVIVNSTKSSLNGTAYIDLDIGEAYAIDGGAVVSINDSVSIGAALPVLGVGSNTVSKTGSVANLEVTPRWWQL